MKALLIILALALLGLYACTKDLPAPRPSCEEEYQQVLSNLDQQHDELVNLP